MNHFLPTQQQNKWYVMKPCCNMFMDCNNRQLLNACIYIFTVMPFALPVNNSCSLSWLIAECVVDIGCPSHL